MKTNKINCKYNSNSIAKKIKKAATKVFIRGFYNIAKSCFSVNNKTLKQTTKPSREV